MKNTFAISPRNTFPILATILLLLGLVTAVLVSKESQDRRSRAQTASFSLWENTTIPAIISNTDTKAVTLGVKFKPLTNGNITGIKFYKGEQNIGTHSAALWTTSGQMLATGTFTNETTSGWQQMNFATPVGVSANTTYVASYFAPQGKYSMNTYYFTQALVNGSLSAPSASESGGNGVYIYGSSHAFPTSTYGSRNYWVDVLFEPSSETPPPSPTIAPTAVPTATPTPIICPPDSEICLENQKPGNPASEWDIPTGASAHGFATKVSVSKGELQQFKINTSASTYRIDIYRLGYYGGMGARKVATINPSVPLPQVQPACINDTSLGLYDCGNWAVSASWEVPADAVSGVYIAKVVASNGKSQIIFVVRDDESHSDLLVQTSDATWQAYNKYGGTNLYGGAGPGGQGGVGRAYKVSYNRPEAGRSRFFKDEYPMIKWMERNGYDVSYTSSIDTTTRGSEILEHKLFISSGHDEYWSKEMRDNVEAARAAGVNLAFFTANEVFWKTRWENSIDGNGTPYRTLVCYKETHANAKIDPSSEWTGTWRDPRFSPPYNGNNPENALTGTIFTVNNSATSNRALKVPAEDGKMRFWRNTPTANLPVGGETVFPTNTLGYEWDEDLDNGFRPAGIIHMSTTTENVNSYIQDYGSTYGNGTATHHLTLYKHPSGALVFGAGTIQWSWGLDAYHDGSATATDPQMQQATVNLFADMGAQPTSLQTGLVLASKSTDTTPPTAAIVSPANNALVTGGTTVTISGTASDEGGVVGGVEVSVDGGSTWHQAKGRSNWTYDWLPIAYGTVTIKARAIDDSGNIQTNPSQTTVEIDPSQPINKAFTGTGYRWWKNTSSTSNSNKVAATGMNDNNTTQDVSLSNGNTNDVTDAWEAAGIIWTTEQNINSFSFINGSWTTEKNGAFTANLKLQFTTDGTTWVDSGWALSPTYPYNSSTTSGQTYTFNGALASIIGVRIVGQVHTAGSDSYYANVREISIGSPAPVDVNKALTGTGYRWWKNTSSTADTNKVSEVGINDDNIIQDISLRGTDITKILNGWQAAGVTWSTAQNISYVSFTNGSWTTDKNGAFTANLKLQLTTNGTTWTDSGWTFSPAYAYDSPTTAGQTYAFAGPTSSVKGVRITGQVRTPGAKSYNANVRELEAK